MHNSTRFDEGRKRATNSCRNKNEGMHRTSTYVRNGSVFWAFFGLLLLATLEPHVPHQFPRFLYFILDDISYIRAVKRRLSSREGDEGIKSWTPLAIKTEACTIMGGEMECLIPELGQPKNG